MLFDFLVVFGSVVGTGDLCGYWWRLYSLFAVAAEGGFWRILIVRSELGPCSRVLIQFFVNLIEVEVWFCVFFVLRCGSLEVLNCHVFLVHFFVERVEVVVGQVVFVVVE